MDPKKKQELNPELKQIYERVMNTEVKRTNTANPSPTPSAAVPAVPVAPSAFPAPSLQPQPAAPVEAPSPTGPSPAPSPQATAFNPPAAPGGPAPFFTSMPSRATGTPGTAQQPVLPGVKTGMSVKKTGGNGLFSGKIIAALVVMMLAAWGVLWAKIFSLF